MFLGEEEMACEADDVTITMMSPSGVKLLKQAETELREDPVRFASVAKQHVIDARWETREVHLNYCRFVGLVEVRYHQDMRDWTCPVCETYHEEEVG